MNQLERDQKTCLILHAVLENFGADIFSDAPEAQDILTKICTACGLDEERDLLTRVLAANDLGILCMAEEDDYPLVRKCVYESLCASKAAEPALAERLLCWFDDVLGHARHFGDPSGFPPLDLDPSVLEDIAESSAPEAAPEPPAGTPAEPTASPLDLLLDRNNTEPIVLYNDIGDPVEFRQIAVIPLENQLYAILAPVVLLPGMSGDEALVFAAEEENGQPRLRIVEDDYTIDRVFDIYGQLLDQAGMS